MLLLLLLLLGLSRHLVEYNTHTSLLAFPATLVTGRCACLALAPLGGLQHTGTGMTVRHSGAHPGDASSDMAPHVQQRAYRDHGSRTRHNHGIPTWVPPPLSTHPTTGNSSSLYCRA